MLHSFSLFLILIICRISISHEQFLSNVSGQVGKENFTYYSMTYDGTILLELTSISGDCDLYISQNTLKPSFEPDLNCLQSVTCGIDTVIIPKSFKRPIGIGIFGHPSHEVSFYHLLFYRIDNSHDLFHYDSYSSNSLQTNKNKILKNYVLKTTQYEEEKESVFWVLLKSVMEFMIEIIL